MRKTIATALLLLGLYAPAPLAQTNRSMFVYQNNFWLNLHEFLRGEIYRRGVQLTPGVDAAALAEADRKAWESAFNVYTEVAKHDQVFDEGAQRISNALSATGTPTRLGNGLLDAWLPYLVGRTSLAEAVSALVRDAR